MIKMKFREISSVRIYNFLIISISIEWIEIYYHNSKILRNLYLRRCIVMRNE